SSLQAPLASARPPAEPASGERRPKRQTSKWMLYCSCTNAAARRSRSKGERAVPRSWDSYFFFLAPFFFDPFFEAAFFAFMLEGAFFAAFLGAAFFAAFLTAFFAAFLGAAFLAAFFTTFFAAAFLGAAFFLGGVFFAGAAAFFAG